MRSEGGPHKVSPTLVRNARVSKHTAGACARCPACVLRRLLFRVVSTGHERTARRLIPCRSSCFNYQVIVKRFRCRIPSTNAAVKDVETHNSRRGIPGAPHQRFLLFSLSCARFSPFPIFFLSPPKNNTPTNINQIFFCTLRVFRLLLRRRRRRNYKKKKNSRTVTPSSFDKRPEREMLEEAEGRGGEKRRKKGGRGR